jgi:hypothetical protein
MTCVLRVRGKVHLLSYGKYVLWIKSAQLKVKIKLHKVTTPYVVMGES